MHRHEGTILDLVHQRAVDDVSALMLSLMDNHKGTMLEFLVPKRRYTTKDVSCSGRSHFGKMQLKDEAVA